MSPTRLAGRDAAAPAADDVPAPSRDAVVPPDAPPPPRGEEAADLAELDEAAAAAKKIALIDGTSDQEAAALLPVVRELLDEGAYSPVARVGTWLAAHPVGWVGRALVPPLVFAGLMMAMPFAGVRPWRVFEYGLQGFLVLGLPVWAVSGVGVWCDRLLGRPEGGVRRQLARHGPSLAAALPLAAAVAAASFAGAEVLRDIARPLFGWRAADWAPAVSLYLGSLVWGVAACRMVLRDERAPRALVAGAGEAAALTLRTPLYWLRWLRRPSFRKLQAGEGMVLPYLAFAWAATVFGAIGALLTANYFGFARYGQQWVALSLLAVGASMAFEAAVGVGTLNYLAAWADREAPPPALAEPGDLPHHLPEARDQGQARQPEEGA